MPKLWINPLLTQRGWTKIPNLILDRYLKELGDAELRILLVILRRQIGFHRNTPLFLTYRAIRDATGKHSEATSRALKSLSSAGLIHIAARESGRESNNKTAASEAQQYKENLNK